MDVFSVTEGLHTKTEHLEMSVLPVPHADGSVSLLYEWAGTTVPAVMNPRRTRAKISGAGPIATMWSRAREAMAQLAGSWIHEGDLPADTFHA